MGAQITGWGYKLPEKVITNDDLAKQMDTSDTWIRERTGIAKRHIGGTTSELAIEAGKAALAKSGTPAEDIGLVILATASPDRLMPATSAKVHERLGIKGGAFDCNAACAGFIYALLSAYSIADKFATKVLLIGSDTLSRFIDTEDRQTAVLFGDGAGALVIEPDAKELILGFEAGTNGSGDNLLHIDHGDKLKMNGKEVFKQAVRNDSESIKLLFQKTSVSPKDIKLFVPHQANIRIIEAVTSRIDIPMENTMVTISETGNTTAASIPLALAQAADAGRLTRGDLVLLSGFGAGMTWASVILRW
jgi:3-oxoacyl-[acyl-carrier-protein] synthase-3